MIADILVQVFVRHAQGPGEYPTCYFQLTIIEELVAKKNTKSPIWDYFGFNHVEPTSKAGVSTLSRSGDIEQKVR